MHNLAPSYVRGEVTAGFEPVKEAFAKVMASGTTLGAACTIYYRGNQVVNLFSGWHDKQRTTPWLEDTLVLVYSLSKGLTALSCALAVSDGLFDYDEPIANVWPEFARMGKDGLTIGQVLSEQGAVAALDIRLNEANMADQDAMATAIAAQRPNWVPGRLAGNHAHTLGWLACELIRRRDHARRSLGCYFAEKIAGPLAADAWIGLPAPVDRARIARIDGFGMLDLFLRHRNMPWSLVCNLFLPWSLSFRVLNNPFFLAGPGGLDCEQWRAIELGGAGAIGSAAAIAEIYNSLTVGARARLKPNVLQRLCTGQPRPSDGIFDPVLGRKMYYSYGFEKPIDDWQFARTGSAFGTFAVGGSLAYADPEDEVAYCWLTNTLSTWILNDPREKAVRDAFYACI